MLQLPIRALQQLLRKELSAIVLSLWQIAGQQAGTYSDRSFLVDPGDRHELTGQILLGSFGGHVVAATAGWWSSVVEFRKEGEVEVEV